MEGKHPIGRPTLCKFMYLLGGSGWDDGICMVSVIDKFIFMTMKLL